jgi:hypothetical protein
LILSLISQLEINSTNQSITSSTLTYLTTGYKFNQPIIREFDQVVDKLPPTLTHFTTGKSFDQSVDNLPPTLTLLSTDYKFNQPVDKLPPTPLTSQLEQNSITKSITFHHTHSPQNWRSIKSIS